MRSAKGRNHRLGQAGEAARVADPSRVDGLRPWAGPRISAKGSESGARLPDRVWGVQNACGVLMPIVAFWSGLPPRRLDS